MAAEPFLEGNFRVLTPEIFDYVFHHELERAARSQNFLTFVLLQPRLRGHDSAESVRELAPVISRDIRETDLLAVTSDRHLSLVLLDADLPNALRVVDRLMDHLQHYQFRSPMTIEVGAACCPTHGTDADTLRSAARTSMRPHRAGDAASNG
jgi:hypothetical protein